MSLNRGTGIPLARDTSLCPIACMVVPPGGVTRQRPCLPHAPCAGAASSPATDEHWKKRPFEHTDEEEDTGDEVHKILKILRAEIKQTFLTKRKFEMIATASIKTTKKKIEQVWKMQQEQSQNLHLKYAQRFPTLFQEWNTDMQKLQEQEENLANMFQEKWKILQQASIVQSQ